MTTDFINYFRFHIKGWYRDCGISPKSNIISIYAFSNEYDDRVKKPFLGNKMIRIWGVYGFPQDSLQFRLTDGRLGYDILFLYNLNKTYETSTIHYHGKKYL